MDGKVDNLRKHNTQKKKEPMKKTYELQWQRKKEEKKGSSTTNRSACNWDLKKNKKTWGNMV